MRSLHFKFPLPFTLFLGLATLAGVPSLAAETEDAVTITVQDVSAKAGEKILIIATVTPRNGYRIAPAYNNRIMTLSAADDGVAFQEKLVRGSIQETALVFKVPVTPTKPGAHPINGIIRFAFVSSEGDNTRLDIKSAPLIATVTGTE
jgi:hypothetical protein